VNSLTHPHLIIHTPDGPRQVDLTDGYYWTIGRSRDNTIVLSDQSTSRKHAMLQVMEFDQYYFIDLGSRNGSFIHGRRLTIPVALQHGDRITIGQTELEFIAPEVSSKAPLKEDTPTGTTLVRSQRSLITVVVMDIRDFTRLTQQLPEEMLSEVMGTWFRQAGDIIRQYGSWVDKYIGDAVMAVWIHNVGIGGIGVAPEEMRQVFQALHALSCMSNELNHQFALPFPLRVGAGVNTGPAMVGQMGSGERPEYTALGDTVNAAFRLETATKELKTDIALGENTYRYLQNALPDLPFQQYTVQLKGYEVPASTYAGSFQDLAGLLESKA